jgi:adenylate cyclase
MSVTAPAAPHRSKICIGCWQQLHVPVALRGPFSIPFRVVGVRPSRMNPNTCTICELMFSKIMRARNVTIDATIMFADLRGYTSLSQSLPPAAISGLLDMFYDECANAIWEQDGLLNKTIGDAVMAVFNFPVKHQDHPARAVRAARQIQQRCGEKRQALCRELGIEEQQFGIGIGIESGDVSFGEFGRSHRDLTAIGTVVNMASRAQAAAVPGQILVTRQVFERAPEELAQAKGTAHQLKGFDRAIELYAA